MKRLYRVHEFVELAGVTVKALHHYDRLGLLKPGRTDAGYAMEYDTWEKVADFIEQALESSRSSTA